MPPSRLLLQLLVTNLQLVSLVLSVLHLLHSPMFPVVNLLGLPVLLVLLLLRTWRMFPAVLSPLKVNLANPALWLLVKVRYRTYRINLFSTPIIRNLLDLAVVEAYCPSSSQTSLKTRSRLRKLLHRVDHR